MNTGTITITWDKNDNALNFDASNNFSSRTLLQVGAGLYAAALKDLRQQHGDRWAFDAWKAFKDLVEHKVFTYTVRTPRRLKDREGTDA